MRRGSEHMADEQIEQETAQPDAASVTDSPAAPGADATLDDLLTEFESATAKPAAAPERPANDGPDLYQWERDLAEAQNRERIDGLAADADSNAEARALAESRVAELEQQAQQQAFVQWHNRETSEFAELADRVTADVLEENPYLPPDYARSHLLGLAMRDQTFRDMWDHRHDNPTAKWAFETYLHRSVLRGMFKTIRSLPDRNATEDHAMVVAAVRYGSSSKAPPEQPINLGAMSNNEFRAHMREKYGIATGV